MERKKYRFVGTEATFGDRRLSRLGDVVELTDEEAKSVFGITGLPAAPNEAFEAAGFTPDELKKHGTFGGRANAPATFWEKFMKVQESVGQLAKAVEPPKVDAPKEVKK
jgi:hypothetical protein